MRQTHRAKQHDNPPRQAAEPSDWRQQIVAVGVVQHPTTGHYQVWLHARGQTAMLLAFRTLEQADTAKHALGEALVRGEHATPERWVAAVAAIGTATDIPVEPVSDAVFAAIRATIQRAALVAPAVPAAGFLIDGGNPNSSVRDRQLSRGIRSTLRWLRVAQQHPGAAEHPPITGQVRPHPASAAQNRCRRFRRSASARPSRHAS